MGLLVLVAVIRLYSAVPAPETSPATPRSITAVAYGHKCWIFTVNVIVVSSLSLSPPRFYT